jgi:glycine hydroxymethyltransferase
MAHVAGLIATGEYPSPVAIADVTTTTTHKTLRGPRGGIILCKKQYARAIDRAVFPGLQGGPLMHVIAAKAVAFAEAGQPEWKEYQKRVIENSSVLCEAMKEKGWRIVSGGTDNHLFLIDLGTDFISGKKAERWLGMADITVNKNTVPFDTRKPYIASGLRIGTPAVTSTGMKDAEMVTLGESIVALLRDRNDDAAIASIKPAVDGLITAFPAYPADFPGYV